MFGKYAIFDNARYYLKKEPEIYVEFRPPTAMDEVKIQQFLQNGPVTASPAGVTRSNVRTNPEIAIEELSLLMVHLSVLNEDGKAILHKDMPVDARRDVIAGIPGELLWELWRALGARVPGWGANVPAEAAPEGADPKAEK